MEDGRLRLTRIGYWGSDLSPGWPDVFDFVDPLVEVNEDVVRHLRNGLMVRAYMGPSRCRICGELNGSTELSDGVFIWPEGLVHYVTDHHVHLPARFVDSVAEFHDRFDEAEVDDEWWRATKSL